MRNSRVRAGFTLVELLVVMSIIAILASLLMPAVNAVRERGRQTQCMSNQRNVAIAMTSHDNQRGNLPGWANDVNPDLTTTGKLCTPAGWAFPLLPYLERNDIYQPLTTGGMSTTKQIGVNVPMGTLAQPNVLPQIAVLLCPNDATAKSGPTSSFVANCGFPDTGWQLTAMPTDAGAATSAASQAEGVESAVFHNNYTTWNGTNKNPRTDNSIAIVSAGDGSSTTLMIGENIDATYWHGGPNNTPLGTTQVRESAVCFCWVDAAVGSYPDDFRPNRKTGNYPGRAPRMSSYHPSGVVVAYCDTHTQFLNEAVDPITLALLHSPRGATARNPFDPRNPSTPTINQLGQLGYILDESKAK